MSKRQSATLTGITLPLDVDMSNRDKICRALLAVTRHRLDDITVDLEPLEEQWPPDVEWAVTEAATRIKPRVSRLTGRAKQPRRVIDLDPHDDGDFALASALAAHTWMTAIASDQSIALDTELHVHLWVNPDEYTELIERVLAEHGDPALLESDPELKPWYT